MNGQEVYRFAVKTVPKAVTDAVEQAGLHLEEIDLFLLHQANYRIIEAVSKRLGQPMEKVSDQSGGMWEYFCGECADFA